MTTKDGYEWTPSTGLTSGLACAGAVDIPLSTSLAGTYDVIVIGSGFAGLVASRDLALRGLRVLLVEARDRIGGRALTCVADGFPFEIGASWIQWNQPHTYGQISRYDLKGEIKAMFDTSGGVNVTDIHFDQGEGEEPMRMTHEEEDSIHKRPAELYFDVDGERGRKVLPFPHDPFHNPEIRQYDQLSAFGRLDQIRDQLTPLETAALKCYLLLMSGGTAETAGFFDMLRWWSLCDYGVNDYSIAYKLRCGTTGLAKRIFADGRHSGNLAVALNTPVSKIRESDGHVSVTTMGGATYTASHVISTIPLNVLRSITFDPPLGALKAAAIENGHSGLHTKIHYEVRGQDFRSWSGYSYPGSGLLYAYGDDTTPAANTHIVSFGAASKPLFGEDDIEKTKKALLSMRGDLQIERVLFHDWVRDPYARGSWCMFPKEFASKYLAALQERHGNVWFASSDWADGWRGFIDGALEQGMTVAQRVADVVTTERSHGSKSTEQEKLGLGEGKLPKNTSSPNPPLHHQNGS